MAINSDISLRKASLLAGIGYILMFGTPLAEFMVFNKLVDLQDTHGTVENIKNNLSLFQSSCRDAFVDRYTIAGSV